MKKTILTIIALLCIVGSQAKDKDVVWEKPTTENGNVYGDGFFNIAIDMNRVDLISIVIHYWYVTLPWFRYAHDVNPMWSRSVIGFTSNSYRVYIEFTIEEQ